MLPFTIDELEEEIDEGWVTRRDHPYLPLNIYNYSASCQYERHWNTVTETCRGLILDYKYDIVARPFKKIFNYGEWDPEDIPTNLPWKVQQKLDGSLIICALYKDEIVVATRGSFESEQAEWSRNCLKENYPNWRPAKGVTHLFECVYPENRICVDYGNLEDLIALAHIDTRTGKDIAADIFDFGWEGLAATSLVVGDIHKTVEWMKEDPKENLEGYVFTWSDGTRIKIKYDEYVRLHSIIYSYSKRRVWECLSKGGDFMELIDNVPDEFYNVVKTDVSDLNNEYETIKNTAISEFNRIKTIYMDKKDFALAVKDHELKAILFKMWDDKVYADTIWKMIKP